MEFLPDRAHVRLKSVVRQKFLHACMDGRSVTVTAHRESLNTAWLVHRVERDGATRVLLHSAAYARYLAVSNEPAPHGHGGQRAVQNFFDTPLQDDIVWEAITAGDHIVVLLHASNRLLRANGRYCIWRNAVSVDNVNNQSTMMHWKVEAIPPRQGPPELPLPIPFAGVFQRTIYYVEADNLEQLNPNPNSFMFPGRSVAHLRTMVALALHKGDLTITLCVRAGSHGRLIPLITDLPPDEITHFIVVLPVGSPAAQALVYPDVNAL